MDEGRVKIELVYEPEGWDAPLSLLVETDRGVYIREEGFTYQTRSIFFPWDAVRSLRRYVVESDYTPDQIDLLRTTLGHRTV